MLVLDRITVSRPPQLFHYNFRCEERETVAIRGVSGVGKSTLLEAIAGYIPVSTGVLTWCGQDLRPLSPRDRPITMMFQDNNLFEHISVMENLALAGTSIKRRELEDAAEALQIAGHLGKLPGQLSGGQRQRVALIRTMLRPEPLILLDEPYSELDEDTRRTASSWTRDTVKAKGKTLLVVTHQVEDVSRLADRVIQLS